MVRQTRGKKVPVKVLLKRFFSNERGLELVEYGVLTALVVASLVVSITLLATAIGNRIDSTAGDISSLPP